MLIVSQTSAVQNVVFFYKDTVYFYFQSSESEQTGGILPLVFGLPFASEISSYNFKSSPAKVEKVVDNQWQHLITESQI